MKTMFSIYYHYFYFTCLCLYLDAIVKGAVNGEFPPSNDSFDYVRRFTTPPTEVRRWKSTAKATVGQQTISSSEDTISGMKNTEEEKNKNSLPSNRYSIKEVIKAIGKRDAKEEKFTLETLPNFQGNSHKPLADFFKDFNNSMVTPASNIYINSNGIIASSNDHISIKENEINLESNNDIVEVTTDEELTAEDRYPNFVPTYNSIDVDAKPNLFELGYVKHLAKDFVFPETGENTDKYRQDGSKAGNIQDDIFTTVKAIQEIIYDPYRSNVTVRLNVLGEGFKAFVDVLKNATFMPNAQAIIHDKESTKSMPLSDLEDLHMYEGSLNSKNSSYACGSIVDSFFTGILMLENGTIWYVERPETDKTAEESTSVKETDLSFHNCAHTNHSCHENMISGCQRKERNKITCFEGRHERKKKLNSTKRQSMSNNRSSSHRLSSDSFNNASCAIELVSDASHFVKVHNQSILPTLREILTVVLQANRILNEVDFDGDGRPENLSLLIGGAVMYSSDRDDGPATNESFMDQRLNAFLTRPQNSCLSLGFLSSDLTDEEPISITYSGSICQGSLNETRPRSNGAVVNTVGPKNRRRSLLPMSLRVTETIGEMMGSLEAECEDPSSGDSWLSFFPDCTRESMVETLALRGTCLETPPDYRTRRLVEGTHSTNGSLCGNGIVNSGEECDCGNDCQTSYSCCIQSGRKNECQIDRSKGHECEWTDPCCTMSCMIVPKDWKKFCGSGDPSCGPRNAYCDGNSSACPDHGHNSNDSDGHRCGPGNLKQVGAGTCRSGLCDGTVCGDAELEDCHCVHKSRKSCKVCCKKKGKGSQCLPAETFGLMSNVSDFFNRFVGLPCSTDSNEYCDSMGTCTSIVSSSGESDILYTTLIGKGMSTTALIAWTVLWRVMGLRLV